MGMPSTLFVRNPVARALLLALAAWTLPGLARAEDPAPAAKKPAGTQFIRIVRDAKNKPVSMDVAIVRYVSKDPAKNDLVVDLVGAVHVGERSYYERLNSEFQGYDALLYELVAPEGTRVQRGAKTSNGHPVGALQNGLKGMLGLEHQLEVVDYQAENFVHADMTPEEFAKSMSDRNESLVGTMFRLMGAGIGMQGSGNDIEMQSAMMQAMFDSSKRYQLKRAMAMQMQQMGALEKALGGENGSTLLTERNKAAFEVLAAQIKAGKRKLGVFYGAAHLPDMEQRLRDEFGLVPQETRWLEAWNLRAPK